MDWYLEAQQHARAAGLVARGQLQPALAFVSQHPDALWLMLLLSLAATSGILWPVLAKQLTYSKMLTASSMLMCVENVFA